MIDYDTCIRMGWLTKITQSKKQAEEQLKKAEVLFAEAKIALKNNSPNSATMTAYAAILDAGRALLFKDGWREKSHACTARYLERTYTKELGEPAIMLFDEYRDKRHKTLYSGDYYPTMEEAKRIVEFAEQFLEKVKKIM